MSSCSSGAVSNDDENGEEDDFDQSYSDHANGANQIAMDNKADNKYSHPGNRKCKQ